MKRLIIFTNAFPYGNGYNWITEELKCFSNTFDEVYISPFSYEGNAHPVELPAMIKVLSPVNLYDIEYKSLWQFFKLRFSRLPYYLKEFFREKVYTNSYWFKTWLKSCLLTDQLLESPNFKFLKSLDHKSNTLLYFYWGNNQAFLIPFLRKFNFKKILVRFHGFDLYKERLGGYQAFRRPQLKNMDIALPISTFGMKYLQNNYRDIKFRSEVARLGTIHFGFSPENHTEIFRIVSCARLIKLKRIELIAGALRKIEKQRIAWTHIGDGEELERIKNICHGRLTASA